MHHLFRQRPEIEAAPLEEECILYRPAARSFLHLNRTASLVWSLVKEPSSIEEIAGTLARRFRGVEPDAAARDVETLLRQMISLSVVEALPGGSDGRPVQTESP